MSAVMILFAFFLSLIINFVQKMVHPTDNNLEPERAEHMDNYAVEETE